MRGARGVGAGEGAGTARAAPGTLGAPAPRRPSGARTRTPSAPVREGEDGRFGFSIKALCCAHTKAAETRFCSRPCGRSEGTQLSFQKAVEACGGGSHEGERARAGLPPSATPTSVTPRRPRRGRLGVEVLRQGRRKEANLLSPSRPKGGY